MRQPIRKLVTKVSLLTLLFVVLFNIGIYFFASTSTVAQKTENKTQFVNSNNPILADIGVAIGTNIGTRHSLSLKIPATIYKDVMTIGDIIGDSQRANNLLITANMLYIKEYLNLLKTDIIAMLDKPSNRKDVLESFISGLETRYKQAFENEKALIKQRTLLTEELARVSDDLNTIKEKISVDFAGSKIDPTIANIDTYLELKEKYTFARTYIIYLNQFTKQYNFLNSYNKILLDTLINNKEALVNKSFVVLPDSGNDLMKKLNLIYSEAEFKSLNKDEEEKEED